MLVNKMESVPPIPSKLSAQKHVWTTEPEEMTHVNGRMDQMCDGITLNVRGRSRAVMALWMPVSSVMMEMKRVRIIVQTNVVSMFVEMVICIAVLKCATQAVKTVRPARLDMD